MQSTEPRKWYKVVLRCIGNPDDTFWMLVFAQDIESAKKSALDGCHRYFVSRIEEVSSGSR